MFSLSGLVPLGFFLLEHVWMNASALHGQNAYTSKAEALGSVPLIGLLELLLVWLPLAYHAGYGLLVLRGPTKGPLPRTWAVADRGASVVVLVFIVWHLVEYRLPSLRGSLGAQSFYSLLVWRFSSVWHGFPVRASLYLIGILATTFHFAAGAWSYGVNSTLLGNDEQKRRGAVWLGVLGSVLFLVAAATVVSLATGVQLEATTDAPPCEPQK